MARALQKGLMGARQSSLAPSLAAMGPNRYLRERDFMHMLGVALLLHVLVIGIVSFMPEEKVTDIPVRALSFKIGGQDKIAAYGAPTAAPAPQEAPAPTTNSSEWRASPQQAPTVTPAPLKPLPQQAAKPQTVPVPVKPRVIPMVPPEQRSRPVENDIPEEGYEEEPPPLLEPTPPVQYQPPPLVADPVAQPLPSTDILTRESGPAIASQPQRFVREVGNAPAAQPGLPDGMARGEGTENMTTDSNAIRAIRERYEQQISSWIQTHKLYPASANGEEGRTVMRIRIDRTGYVRYYAVEESSGNDVLDAAAVDMIRRANPVPPVPNNYPSGNLIEFLIPITFRAPQ